VVVNLDPYRRQNSMIDVPIEYSVRTKASHTKCTICSMIRHYTWFGRRNYVEARSSTRPAIIFRLRRLVRTLVCAVALVALS